MPSCAKAVLVLCLNLALVLGTTTILSDPRIQQLATRMDLIGVVNGKVLAANISQGVQQGTAQAYCQDNNATVAIIESDLETDLIRNYMAEKNVPAFWTDLSDYGHEGTWVWTSSGQVLGPNSYTNWAAGQPFESRRMNCAYMSTDGAWRAYRCTAPDGDSSTTVRPLCQLLLN